MSALLTIKKASEEKGFSSVYIRKAIRDGALETQLEPISEDSEVERHVFTEEAWDAWRASVGKSRSRREDGRTRYKAYMTPEEHEALAELVEKSDLDYNFSDLVEKAYKPKKS